MAFEQTMDGLKECEQSLVQAQTAGVVRGYAPKRLAPDLTLLVCEHASKGRRRHPCPDQSLPGKVRSIPRFLPTLARAVASQALESRARRVSPMGLVYVHGEA